MKRNLKLFAIILAFFSFSTSLFAESVTYSFSSFGGGLPSSAARVSMAATDTTQQRIIVEDGDEDTTYDYSDEPTTKKGKNAGLIVTYVIVGVVITAGIIVGAYYLTDSSVNCCASATESILEGCGEGCGEACAASMDEACATSMNEACASSGENVNCSGQSIGSLLVNGFELIPIYVP